MACGGGGRRGDGLCLSEFVGKVEVEGRIAEVVLRFIRYFGVSTLPLIEAFSQLGSIVSLVRRKHGLYEEN